ncbi:hypothetical protein [[Pseudomonas] boreopolis]|uniref:hypothetical protein n=1 Tax=Xanthomonas boreopolis TaxID=86183 RepID=UPI003D9AC37C
MNRINRTATLGAVLVGGSLLASPGFAMTDLAQGYALGAAQDTTGTPKDPQPQQTPVPRQDAAPRPQEKQDASEPAPAHADKAKHGEKKKDASGKQMSEGKCGEGKCGGAF